jgi:hypothetical protein
MGQELSNPAGFSGKNSADHPKVIVKNWKLNRLAFHSQRLRGYVFKKWVIPHLASSPVFICRAQREWSKSFRQWNSAVRAEKRWC